MITPQQIDPLAGTAGYDSTAAISGAIAACLAGGEVAIPATTSGYLISNGFTITQSISVIGEGFGSNFTGTLPAGVDLFHIKPVAGQSIRGVRFKNLKSSVVGSGHMVHFDTLAANANIAEVEVYECWLACMAGANGIFIDNAASNGNGGTFDADFEKNVIIIDGAASYGIGINNGGDSIRVRGGEITGTGIGIYCNQIANAGNLVVSGGINISSSGGICINRGLKPVIRDFEMEFLAGVYTGAAINVAGSLGIVDGAFIGPGSITVIGAPLGFGEAIYLANASNWVVQGMSLASDVGGTGINISSASLNGCIGVGNSYAGFSTNITNGSSSTRML